MDLEQNSQVNENGLAVNCAYTGSGRSNAYLSVVGRVIIWV